MGTIIQSVTPKRGTYRQHPVAFKRAVVEQSLTSGVSVARIARQHDVNANQVFAWRKLFKEGRLGEAADTGCQLLPVLLAPSPVSAVPPTGSDGPAAPGTGVIELVVGAAKLRLEGHVDTAVLSLVLEHLRP
ncbi:transposase [Collimonas sp. PA-H2]|uniref:IS66-like element accessory protein TnpA n=1 Tax=Collimonas sp. PA-H2 TaxID=1881062 RepID=UPI000BF3CAA4|nr:transposase [Collimonas sp. PA-H2]